MYAPALVAFFNVGPNASIGFSSAGVGWVALSWGEPVLPWWGRPGFAGRPWWGGWGGPRVVNNAVVRNAAFVNVNKINYNNFRVNNAVSATTHDRFGNGRVHDDACACDTNPWLGEYPWRPAGKTGAGEPGGRCPEWRASSREHIEPPRDGYAHAARTQASMAQRISQAGDRRRSGPALCAGAQACIHRSAATGIRHPNRSGTLPSGFSPEFRGKAPGKTLQRRQCTPRDSATYDKRSGPGQRRTRTAKQSVPDQSQPGPDLPAPAQPATATPQPAMRGVVQPGTAQEREHTLQESPKRLAAPAVPHAATAEARPQARTDLPGKPANRVFHTENGKGDRRSSQRQPDNFKEPKHNP